MAGGVRPFRGRADPAAAHLAGHDAHRAGQAEAAHDERDHHEPRGLPGPSRVSP